MSKILRPTLFGNPILREKARRLTPAEITSPEIQELIADMQYTLVTKKYGVGLAAPQVGKGIALSVIWVKPLPHRPELKEEKLVIINPEVIKTYGKRSQKWEGCVSFQGSNADFPYAKALRWSKIRGRFLDETGKPHERDMDGMLAHVFQHETDHLNGILFVDRIRDTKTWTMISEYKKRILPQERKKKRL